MNSSMHPTQHTKCGSADTPTATAELNGEHMSNRKRWSAEWLPRDGRIRFPSKRQVDLWVNFIVATCRLDAGPTAASIYVDERDGYGWKLHSTVNLRSVHAQFRELSPNEHAWLMRPLPSIGDVIVEELKRPGHVCRIAHSARSGSNAAATP